MFKKKEEDFENYKELKKKNLTEKKRFRIDPNIIHAVSLLGYIGFLLIGSILINIGIYKIIEKYFSYKSNVLFLIFVLLGVISGFYNIYKVIMKK